LPDAGIFKLFKMSIKTVFQVTIFGNPYKKIKEKTEIHTVQATGQKAASAIDKKYAGQRIIKILKGFIIDDTYKPADLTSHWRRTLTIPFKP
jgi:hypothetical protein